MINAGKIIRDHVLDQAGVTTLVSTRVYAERSVPVAGYKPGDGACLCFQIRGGKVDLGSKVLLPSVQFTCWAPATASQRAEVRCNVLYRALFDALESGGGNGVLHSYLETLGQTLWHPDSGWPFVLCAFRILLNNQE